MNIRFIDMQIQSFQCIGKASIELARRGFVTISGINNYEDNVSSNGSGKSSIPSALFWCLYGKTPEGIINPTNRYFSEVCQVRIKFLIDDNEYIVQRKMNKTSQVVDIYINGELQAPRNKSDSDKFIQHDILCMSPDIFLSLIYLSQGFNGRLSMLSPTARKDRLEQLTDTARLIEEFSQNLSEQKTKIMNERDSVQQEVAKRGGSISTYMQMISEHRARIEKACNQSLVYEYDGKTYSHVDIPKLEEDLRSLREQLNDKRVSVNQLNTQLSTISSTIRILRHKLDQNEQSQKSLESQIRVLETGHECPTCHQTVSVENAMSLITDYRNQLENYSEDNLKITDELNESQTQYEKLNELKVSETFSCQSLEDSINIKSKILSNIPPVNDVNIEELQKDIKNYTDSIEKLTQEVDKLNDKYVEIDTLSGVISHCQQLATKPFRAYLLRSTVEFLNSRLKVYSQYLFSNEEDVISISVDSQKLGILLGQCEYVTLSGGERRRVDLAITLAQKDLASELAGIHSNLLILDEIMENMDEAATQATLQLLESQSQSSESLESMFIISHNNYAIPVDSRIIVEKSKDRVAYIREQ